MMVMILIMKIIFLVPDSYVKLLIIIKYSSIFNIINSILKIDKKVYSQVYLEECNFINDSYKKNG